MHFSSFNKQVGRHVCALGVATAVGCGAANADDHPLAEGDDDSSSASTQASTVSTTANAGSEVDANARIAICAPGEMRECRKYWVDIRRQQHCTLSTQFCKSDGFSWLACGDRE